MRQPTRLMRSMVMVGALFLAASGGGQVPGQVYCQTQTSAAVTSYRLASAQVVTSTDRPPVLKLTASGPIAFQPLPTDANGDPAGPNRVVARLFGVAPGDLSLASSGELAPFALIVAAAESGNATDADTIVTITTGAASAGAAQMLVLRAGMKSNEIEAAIVPVP